jgi:hypothetical protein
MFRFGLTAIGVAAVAAFGFIAPASATTVDATYQGHVFSGLGTDIPVGTTFVVHFSYNDAVLDTNADPTQGLYNNALLNFSVNFSNGATYSSTLSPTGNIQLENDQNPTPASPMGSDLFYVVLNKPATTNLSAYTAGQGSLALIGPFGNLITDSEHLPNPAPALNLLTLSELDLQFITADAESTSVTVRSLLDAPVIPVTTTPIPATLPLFLAGLGGLGFVGMRRRQTASRTA